MPQHRRCGSYSVYMGESKSNRKFVGFDKNSPGRKDFVRPQVADEETCYTCQVNMFVKLSGFGQDSGIILPQYLRDADPSSVVLALVRWLSPHPRAIIRDAEQRPICSPPFDINHALWTYTKTPHARFAFRGHMFGRQRGVFGSDADTQRSAIDRDMFAHYDLLDPRSFQSYVNCTSVDEDPCTFLETITLPFQ